MFSFNIQYCTCHIDCDFDGKLKYIVTIEIWYILHMSWHINKAKSWEAGIYQLCFFAQWDF